jgi:hypothetical protein
MSSLLCEFKTEQWMMAFNCGIIERETNGGTSMFLTITTSKAIPEQLQEVETFLLSTRRGEGGSAGKGGPLWSPVVGRLKTLDHR